MADVWQTEAVLRALCSFFTCNADVAHVEDALLTWKDSRTVADLRALQRAIHQCGPVDLRTMQALRVIGLLQQHGLHAAAADFALCGTNRPLSCPPTIPCDSPPSPTAKRRRTRLYVTENGSPMSTAEAIARHTPEPAGGGLADTEDVFLPTPSQENV